MLTRAPEHHGRTLEADLCIVGAGSAGIALAREFQARSALRVVLLESGDLEPDPRTQALYEGEWIGPIGDASYLISSRNRALGGTTALWTGTCRPHDPIDFEERPWVPDSGWPIPRETLLPYYEKAAGLLEVRPVTDDGPDGALFPFNLLPGDTEDVLVPKLLHSSPPTRFADAYAPALVDSGSVHLILRANVVDIRRASRDSALIDRVEVATLEGGRFSVRARRFVLATGAFENARLLLNARRDQPEGLGNQHDNVGRYYMDHTHARPVGLLAFPDDTALANLANEGAAVVKRLGHGYYFVFGPAREVQHRLGLLNGALRLVGLGSSSALAPADLELALQVGRLASNLAGSEGRLDDAATGAVFAFEGYPEEAPNRASRVGLSEQADELGQRKIRVEWQATEQTRQGLRRLLELLSRDAGRTGLGRVRVQLVEGTYDENAVFYNHAAGTTRMHADPRRGVTDADGRVHGTANLFVAGSSLFPTAGFVNPMMTILALALRLADHLNTSMERN